MEYKGRIAIDFDGTIVKPIPYPRTDYEMLEGCEKTIRYLDKQGYKLIMYTARYGWWRLPAIWYIWKKKLPIETPLFNYKPRANYYIDNHNLFCKEINWQEIYDYFKSLEEKR